MKKVQYSSYGDPTVISIVEIQKPVPKAHEVLVKIKAAGVNELDWKIRNGNLKMVDGKGFPKSMGCEFSGDIEVLGSSVHDFNTGDAVFGWLPFDKLGAYAEYVTVNPDSIEKKPGALTYNEAAGLPMVGTTALKALESATKGQHILVNGATGGLGHLAVQIAKAKNANVTAVASARGMEFLMEMNADHIFDYHKTDIKEQGKSYDLIIDTSKKLSWAAAKPLLTPKGIYIDLQPNPVAMIGSLFLNLFSSKKRKVLGVSVTKNDLSELATLFKNGQLKINIGKRYAFENVREALFEMEHKKVGIVGKAVIEI